VDFGEAFLFHCDRNSLGLNMPKVSVIVPNYNHARFLPKRIESILNQTFQDFELILLDDCSTDDSRSILSSYTSDPRVTIAFNETNSGSTFKQWNKGVRLARGKYVWIAESDDYADVRLLEKLVRRLDEDPSTVLCYCRSLQVSADGEPSGSLESYFADIDPLKWTADFRADGREECRKYLIRRNTIFSASSLVFRRDVYWQIGGADEQLVFCGDWKTWAGMALAGGAIAYVAEPLNYYRSHDTSVTTRSQREGVGSAEALRVIRWIFERVEASEADRRALCDEIFYMWTPAVLNGRIPLARRRAILRDARGIDPHALRRLVLPALTALRLTLSRRWRSMRGGLLRPPESGIKRTDGAGRSL
jgi:glycosyltransferase involved in cell wall biosynthesis